MKIIYKHEKEKKFINKNIFICITCGSDKISHSEYTVSCQECGALNFMRWQVLGGECKGVCQIHKAEPVLNRIRYKIGQKRCTNCAIFISVIGVRCPCCKSVLRTGPKNKNRIWHRWSIG